MTINEFQEKFGIIGRSKAIRDLVDITMQVAKSDITVLIQGESGVGKEVFARAIHESSPRFSSKMVSVNCGAIPEGILESELFGHQKGSFTGATDTRKGYFEIADGGTLFLDEIAEMPVTTQVKLLRVLETREFMRIGSETTTCVDVRIIAAANKDLQHEVNAKRFRKDLYFRLKAVTLYIPPLRERREDIPQLVYNFMEKYSAGYGLPELSITPEAMQKLINYRWPGNIRELKNTIETAAALSKTGELDESAFDVLLDTQEVFSENRNLPVHMRQSTEELDRELIYRALIEIKKDLIDLRKLAMHNHNDQNNYGINVKEVVPLHRLEKEAIINTLEFTNGNKRKAAKLLEISERTFYRKLKEYDLI